jgi:hypothetical protein
MKKVTKFLIILHRYLGLALSILFVVWFLSGFAMMYVKYPTMRPHERMQNLPPVNLTNANLTLPQALSKAGITDTLRLVRLGMMLDRPVYRITTFWGKYYAVFADNGEKFTGTDTLLAGQLAVAFLKNKAQPAKLDTLHQIDQWMAAHQYQGYMPPAYRFEMNDAAKTYLYVSLQTGEVVQMVTAKQRFLAWLGPIPHWIYPTILLRNRPLWTDIIIWSSTLGSVMCLAGIVLGLVRYKKNKKKPLEFSPYKKKWFRWHHYTGFVFGIFVFTWVFSGLLSMTPWDWAPFTRLDMEQTNQWNGGVFNPDLFHYSPKELANQLKSDLRVKEIQLTQVDGKAYYLSMEDELKSRLIPADTPAPAFELFNEKRFISKVQELHQGVKLIENKLLTEYDDYYYSKNSDKRLPVLRIKIDTPEQHWYYIDLHTGQVVLKHEKTSRLERWLYHGLHSFDFRLILHKRPLWDIIVIILMLGGTAVSVNGLVLSLKLVKRKLR